MKISQYIEGKEAQGNFEEGMKALFNVPKDSVVKAEKAKKRKKASLRASLHKPTIADKD